LTSRGAGRGQGKALTSDSQELASTLSLSLNKVVNPNINLKFLASNPALKVTEVNLPVSGYSFGLPLFGYCVHEKSKHISLSLSHQNDG
jgi:hypothetical protein